MKPRKPSKPTKEELEWQAQAAQYKADGYNSGVVARKMIQVHGMPEPLAAEVVGQLFGKTVNPRAGDTTSAVIGGLAMVVVGLAATAALWMIVGLRFFTVMIFAYGALLAVAGKGATQVII